MNRDESRLISFYKMSGSGNDFIIIDNRDLSLNVGDLPTFARQVCARKISVGADGLFLIEPSEHRSILNGSFLIPTAPWRKCAATAAAVWHVMLISRALPERKCLLKHLPELLPPKSMMMS